MRRRTFLGCGAWAALAAAAGPRPPEAGGTPGVRRGPRTRLLAGRAPLRTADLRPHHAYVFAYPYEGTPCVLLDLDRDVPGGPARIPWPGGVGPRGSVVAYSAICSHQYIHPTPEKTLFYYASPEAPAAVTGRGGLIVCCAHGSAFDPGAGAVPVQPPAELPLTTVLLEWDPATDGLHAVGLVGRVFFDELFRSFPATARAEVGDTTAVRPLEEYSRVVLTC